MCIEQLKKLVCPFCAGSLEVEHRIESPTRPGFHGVVRCSCRRWPVTHNILNFGGKHGFAVDRAVAFLLADDVDGATAVQLETETLRTTLPGRIVRKLSQWGFAGDRVVSWYRLRTAPRLLDAGSFAEAVSMVDEGSFGQYLRHRYSLPSFHAALPMCTMLRTLSPGSILDLGCGAGHYTVVLRHLFPEAEYTGIDQHYANLLLGQLFLTPTDDLYICINLKHPPPVRDCAFDLMFASDILHTLSIGSTAAQRYMARVTAKGVVYSARFDHCWGKEFAFPPTDHPNVLPNGANVLLDEHQVITQAHSEENLSVTSLAAATTPETCRSYCLLSSPELDVMTLESSDHPQLPARVLHNWCISPCFEEIASENGNRRFALRNELPIPQTDEWRHSVKPLAPKDLDIPEKHMSGLTVDRKYPGLPDLIRSHAVCFQPPRYADPEDSGPPPPTPSATPSGGATQ